MKNKKTKKQTMQKETVMPEIPTIPVVPGVKVQAPAKKSHHKDDSDITWALMLIIAGVLLLLNNTGILPWAIWGVLWRFWPVLFILWGLQLIAGRSLIGKIFMFTVTLLTLCGVAGFAVLLLNTELRDRVNNQFPALQLGKLESFNTSKETVNEKILRGEFSNVERHKVNMSFNEGKFTVTDVLGGEWVTVDGEIQKPRVSFSLNSYCPRNIADEYKSWNSRN
jgi:hypothetical protein